MMIKNNLTNDKGPPWELGSGRFSLGTRCMTQVLPAGSPSAPRVTLPCRNRPWGGMGLFGGGIRVT